MLNTSSWEGHEWFGSYHITPPPPLLGIPPQWVVDTGYMILENEILKVVGFAGTQ